jgi:hypothetical protein
VKELEKDIIDTFRLYTVSGLVSFAEDNFRTSYSHMLSHTFEGLLPSQDTQAQRESTKHTVWPPANIRHLIEKVGSGTVLEYLDKAIPLFREQLPRQLFILLTTALDSFLERRNFTGTLGKRFGAVQKKILIPPQLEADLHEVIQRRNDTAHGGGIVSNDYIQASKYKKLTNSSWVIKHGVPSTSGMAHDFNPEYLYWVTSTIYEFAKIVP